MKHILMLISALITCNLLFAQSPDAFKYQAVIRDNAGEIIKNQEVDFRISLLQDSEKGMTVYREMHAAKTNDYGLVNFSIGTGEVVTGNFKTIEWGAAAYFVKVETRQDKDGAYEIMGTSQLLSVPYALHARTADQFTGEIDAGGTQQESAAVASLCNDDPYNWCDDCQCSNGVKTMQVLYLGPSGDDLYVYSDIKLQKGIDTFYNIQEGQILYIDGTDQPLGVLEFFTYFVFSDSLRPITRITTSCTERIVGETYGNFSVMSHKDKYNFECNVCDLRDDWKFNGNVVFDLCNRMGTSNRKDLILISDNKSRFKLHKGGMVEVTNLNPTLLSGSLTVDLATDLNSTLNVDGPTDLNSFLKVQKDATFNDHVYLNADPFDSSYISTSTSTGALVVKAGVGIGGKLTAQDLTVVGKTKLADLDVFGGNQSNSPSTGALVVSNNGGAGITGNLNVGGNTKLNGTFGVDGVATFNNTTNSSSTNNGAVVIKGGVGIAKKVNIGEEVKINSATQSTSSTSGALVVSGGVGIGKDLNVAGATRIDNSLYVENGGVFDPRPETGSGHVAKFVNTQDGSGIVIQVGQANPQNKNNFVTFKNSSGTVVGRLEGEHTPADFAANPFYQRDRDFIIASIAFATTDIAIAVLESLQGGAKVVATATSTTACAGFGACFTAPIPSLIIESGTHLVLKIANAVKLGADLAKASLELITFDNVYDDNKGVTLSSGHEDYAEYLERKYYEEDYRPGEVVGMKNGIISRETYAVEKVMVISHNPIVLGGMPTEGKEEYFEKVAFLGQVPTWVMGDVEMGDYLVASGLNNGFAIGKSKDEMTLRDYNRIVGIAWEENREPIGMVNTAIGLNANDLADELEKSKSQVEGLGEEVTELRNSLTKAYDVLSTLIPGFQSEMNWEHSPVKQNNQDKSILSAHSHDDFSDKRTQADDVVYHEVTQVEVDEMINQAREIAKEGGIDFETDPFWSKMETDPLYVADIKATIMEKLDKAAHIHKNVNRDLSKQASPKISE